MRRICFLFVFLFVVSVSVLAITLITNPPESLVYVNDVLIGQTNLQGQLTFDVKKDSKIEVESIGYFPYSFVCSACDSTVHVNLSPISYLYISATPSNSQAIIDGNTYSLPATVTLSAGKHEVLVESEGYIPQHVFVSTPPFGMIRRNFTLQRAGKVTIRSIPNGVVVNLDEEKVGTTPFSTYLPSGMHTVTLSAPGYAEVSTTIHVTSFSTPMNVFLKLRKVLRVTIHSSPANAIVTIASTTFVTPKTLNLVSGVYTYSASQIYSYPTKGILKVFRSGKYAIHLKMKTGMVVFTSNPLGAAVSLDGKFIGQTQKSMKLTYGPHKVRMVGPDGKVWFGRFVLNQQIKTVYGDMINSGMVLINSQPSSGTIVHIGQVWTTVPATLNAAVGVYRVEFFNPNFPSLYRYIEVYPGRITRVNISLEPMASFFVFTKPLGAKISIDGSFVGISPVFSVKVRAGEHLLSVEWPDGKLEKKVYFLKDHVYTFDFTDPNSVKVEFISYPDPLRLEIDGKFKGYTPLFIQLTRGIHTYAAYNVLGKEVENGTLNTTYVSSRTYFFLNGN